MTLVKCKTTPAGVEYYYDTNNNYYWKQPDEETIYPISDVGLKAEPVATLPISSGDYALQSIEPTRYTGSLYDISGYINRLTDSGYTYSIKESTPTMLDIYVYGETDSIRIVYLQNDAVRIYSVDAHGRSQTPPYLH